jgi:hypothetical protein
VIYHANTKWKKVGEAILIADKNSFRAKSISRDKEYHFQMVKESIQQEDIAVLNIHAAGNRTFKCLKQIC